ncbi:hypothetical protein [Aeoliella sp.]|uniref:hypothetical protein n=1 Tax=Aeoliella sp. TaxID=2795800 RepID=UPI003CCB9749
MSKGTTIAIIAAIESNTLAEAYDTMLTDTIKADLAPTKHARGQVNSPVLSVLSQYSIHWPKTPGAMVHLPFKNPCFLDQTNRGVRQNTPRCSPHVFSGDKTTVAVRSANERP